MKVEFIAQPDQHLGTLLHGAFSKTPTPRRIVMVSAFASLQAIMRLKFPLGHVRNNGCDLRMVLGIDMGGTSKDVLKEVASWGIPITIVKNRKGGVTFHPKLYLIEWANRAEIIIGSNNLTEGGFFGNYEGCARVQYELPEEQIVYEEGCRQLQRFLAPTGSVAKSLDEAYLRRLLERSDIPSEIESRARTRRELASGAKVPNGSTDENPFGYEDTPPPPPLPPEVLQALMAMRNEQLRAHKKAARKEAAKGARSVSGPKAPSGGPPLEEQIAPASFYMTLPTLQGESIPGEARIPIPAIEMAQEFWGWPDKYTRSESPRKGAAAGEPRIYQNWKPTWRIWSVSSPGNVNQVDVRMYLYENSSDFRFYARPLINAGADLGDIVRITRIYDPPVEYECVLAKKGTPEHEEWLKYCTVEAKRSGKGRRFGFG